MKNVIGLIVTIVIFGGLCIGSYIIHNNANNCYTKLSASELSKKVADKDSFVLLVTNSRLTADQNFKEDLRLISEENNLKVYYVDVKNMDTDDLTVVMNVVSFDTVPTLAFISKGVETDRTNRLVGYNDDTNNNITTILTKNGYLK